MQNITYTIPQTGIAYPGRRVLLKVSNSSGSSVTVNKLYVLNYLTSLGVEEHRQFVFSLSLPYLLWNANISSVASSYLIPYQQNFLTSIYNYQADPYNSEVEITIPNNSSIFIHVYFVPQLNGYYTGNLVLEVAGGATLNINLLGSKLPDVDNIDTIDFSIDVDLVSGLGTLEIANIL